MCEPATISIALIAATAAVTAGGQLYAADAQSNQQKYKAAVAIENRKVELAGRQDAAKRGELEQMRHWRKVAQLEGAQRAKMGAAGLDLGFGSASDLLVETAQMGYEDSAIIAENTNREIEGYEIRAANYSNEAKAARYGAKTAKTAGYIQAGGTILGAASQIYGMKTPSKAPSGGGYSGVNGDMFGG